MSSFEEEKNILVSYECSRALFWVLKILSRQDIVSKEEKKKIIRFSFKSKYS